MFYFVFNISSPTRIAVTKINVIRHHLFLLELPLVNKRLRDQSSIRISMMFSTLYKLRSYRYVRCFDLPILKSNFPSVLKEFWILNVSNCGTVRYVWFDSFWGLALHHSYVNWPYLTLNETCALKSYKICYFSVVPMPTPGPEVSCSLSSLETHPCLVIDVNGTWYLIPARC